MYKQKRLWNSSGSSSRTTTTKIGIEETQKEEMKKNKEMRGDLL